MSENNINHWLRLKKLVVFQVKLAFDAVRDLLLSPVSIICTIIDMVKGHENDQSRFNQLMKIGDKTDTWLNLFNHSPKIAKKEQSNKESSALSFSSFDKQFPEKNVDEIFDKIEALIRQQHKNGTVTASAKASIDFYLDKISQKNPDAQDAIVPQERAEKSTINSANNNSHV